MKDKVFYTERIFWCREGEIMALATGMKNTLEGASEKLIFAMQQAKNALIFPTSSLQDPIPSTNAAGQKQIRADVVAEEVFFQHLLAFGLNGTLYSEESGIRIFGDPDAEDALILLLDPLDGSKNYQKGKKVGCISLAFGSATSNPTLADLHGGIVLNLYDDEIYTAIRGRGVRKNGLPYTHPLPQESNNKINIYSYDKRVKRFLKLFNGQYTFKSLGSVAWELVLAITRNIDMFLDLRGKVKVHDFAASKLIAEEAGCHFRIIGDFVDSQIPIDNFSKGYSIAASCDEELMNSFISDILRLSG
ncbi:MAG: hypothetical protein D6732_29280 [Methanobacteriota archaeon]|nr:MAG: hypothetical protein D6732_29280 [Euryarchaeota archaeon]